MGARNVLNRCTKKGNGHFMLSRILLSIGGFEILRMRENCSAVYTFPDFFKWSRASQQRVVLVDDVDCRGPKYPLQEAKNHSLFGGRRPNSITNIELPVGLFSNDDDPMIFFG
jgi:hypothetical protein